MRVIKDNWLLLETHPGSFPTIHQSSRLSALPQLVDKLRALRTLVRLVLRAIIMFALLCSPHCLSFKYCSL